MKRKSTWVHTKNIYLWIHVNNLSCVSPFSHSIYYRLVSSISFLPSAPYLLFTRVNYSHIHTYILCAAKKICKRGGASLESRATALHDAMTKNVNGVWKDKRYATLFPCSKVDNRILQFLCNVFLLHAWLERLHFVS